MPAKKPQIPVQLPEAPEPQPEATLGDLLNLAVPSEARPGVMSDDPYDVPPGFSPIPSAAETGVPPGVNVTFRPPGVNVPLPEMPAPFPQDDRPHLRQPPEFLPPGQRWETRIEVVEAYQYPGNLLSAPDWIDRSWIGYADLDPLRGIPPGPCLRVPREGTSESWVVRVGDYVVQQEVKFPDRPSVLRLEVWPKEGFEAYFMPVTAAREAMQFTSSPRPTGPFVDLPSASAGSA